MKNKILIMLATGKTGYAATVQLLKEGYAVRIFVRSRNQKAIELELLGAEIAIGEFDNYHALKTAMQDIGKVYYCYPIKLGMVKDVSLFIKAATELRVEAVVFMGQRIAEFADTGSLMTNETRASYRLFEESGLNVVYFIPGYFADNAFVVTEFVIQLGIMASPFGKGKNPWISNGDMGRCIAALLKNPEPYYGERLFPTGSKSISAKEIVMIFSKILGRKIRLINSPEWLFLKAGIMLGKELNYDTFTIYQAMLYNRQMQMNRFDIEPTDIVKKLTGKNPEDFETITKEYFENSPYRERTFGNWLIAIKKFMIMPFTKVPGMTKLNLLNNYGQVK